MRPFLTPITTSFLSALLCGAALAAPAERQATFDLGHALTLRSFADLTWSRDGTRLVYVVNSADTAENATNDDLWMLDLARGENLRLTRDPRPDISPTFSPGGDTLAFIANRGTGSESKLTIQMMSLHGGESWTFGSFPEAVTEVKWSPDGRSLAYVQLDTLPRALREARKKQWDQMVEDERLQVPNLWVVDLASGKRRRLVSGVHLWYVRWSPDSRSIAFITNPTGKFDDANLQDIGVVSASGGPVRALGVIGGAFAWSPDSKWIACAAGAHRTTIVEKDNLWIAPAAGGAPINLTTDFDENAATPAWSPGSDTLHFHSAQGATTVLASVKVPSAGGPVGPVTLSVDRQGDAGAPVAAASGRIAWVQSRPEAPGEIWIADHPRSNGRAGTALNADIARLRFGSTRRIYWTSSDGIRVGGLLLRPPDARAEGPLKTLVMLHGGPYGSRNGLGFLPLPQYLAAHGYQVFMPNFRSSGGYGEAFMVRQRADWGGQDWRDVTSGIDSLVRWRLADGARLGVFGRSYGGYLTAWAITQTRRFDAAAVFAGAVDLASFYGQSDLQKYRAYEFEGAPWESPEKWARSSPMTSISQVRTPTLIQVGENDRRVPLPQAQQLYRALLGLGVPTQLVRYPREGHVLREPRHIADFYLRLRAWWDRWVR